MSKDARKRRQRNDPSYLVPTRSSGQLKIRMWAVAFLDLMGYRRELMETEVFPLPRTPEDQSELAAKFKRPVNRRELLMNAPRNFFKAVTSARDMRDSTRTPPELRSLLERIQKVRIRTTGFSDSVFFESSLAPDPDHYPISAVLDLVLACASTMMLHLAAGSAVRGGLDVSNGLLKDGHVYAAATVKAVELEKCATFPRILVGEWFVQYLRSFSVNVVSTDREAPIDREIANQILALLYEDPDDGLWGIDYLGESIKRRLGTSVTKPLIEDIVTFANASKAAFREKGDQKLEGYYARLARYVASRLHVWQM